MATDDVISLHLSCEEKQGCVTLEKEDGLVAIVMADSSLVLNDDTVVAAYINRDSVLTVQLSDAASLTLAKVTAQNIGKQLAVVLRERVLANPKISAPIYSGRIEINVDRSTQPPYWETLPWLFKKIYPDREVPQYYPNLKKFFSWALVLLPLVIAMGLIALRRRRQSVKKVES
jgi:hypothetical protein